MTEISQVKNIQTTFLVLGFMTGLLIMGYGIFLDSQPRLIERSECYQLWDMRDGSRRMIMSGCEALSKLNCSNSSERECICWSIDDLEPIACERRSGK